MLILVPSCDAYADAWPGFMGCLDHFWPRHKWPTRPQVVFITNHLDAPVGAKTFKAGSDSGPSAWSGNLIAALAAMRPWRDEPVLLMQEDFFLSAPALPARIDDARHLVTVAGYNCVRVFPCPGPDGGAAIGSNYGEITPVAPYRISCQAALWRPASLLAVLRDGETAAQFELDGTERSRTMDHSYLAWRREVEPWPLQYICSAISRGKWNPDALSLCERLGIALDTSKRSVDGQ